MKGEMIMSCKIMQQEIDTRLYSQVCDLFKAPSSERNELLYQFNEEKISMGFFLKKLNGKMTVPELRAMFAATVDTSFQSDKLWLEATALFRTTNDNFIAPYVWKYCRVFAVANPELEDSIWSFLTEYKKDSVAGYAFTLYHLLSYKATAVEMSGILGGLEHELRKKRVQVLGNVEIFKMIPIVGVMVHAKSDLDLVGVFCNLEKPCKPNSVWVSVADQFGYTYFDLLVYTYLTTSNTCSAKYRQLEEDLWDLLMIKRAPWTEEEERLLIKLRRTGKWKCFQLSNRKVLAREFPGCAELKIPIDCDWMKMAECYEKEEVKRAVLISTIQEHGVDAVPENVAEFVLQRFSPQCQELYKKWKIGSPVYKWVEKEFPKQSVKKLLNEWKLNGFTDEIKDFCEGLLFTKSEEGSVVPMLEEYLFRFRTKDFKRWASVDEDYDEDDAEFLEDFEEDCYE